VEETAARDAIVRSYKSLAKRYHPDRTTVTKQGQRELLNQITIRLNAAFEVISHEERRAQYDQELARQRAQAEHLFVEGRRLLAEGKLNEARDVLARAQSLDRSNARIATSHAWSLFLTGSKSPDRIADMLHAALALDQNLGEAHLCLARLYVYQGKLPEARQQMLRIAVTDPAWPAASKLLADL